MRDLYPIAKGLFSFNEKYSNRHISTHKAIVLLETEKTHYSEYKKTNAPFIRGLHFLTEVNFIVTCLPNGITLLVL